MTPQEIAAIITLARRAPLKNMDEAVFADQLLQKLASHFHLAPKSELETPPAVVPNNQ